MDEHDADVLAFCIFAVGIIVVLAVMAMVMAIG